MNIFLIGFMGSGKSVIGRKLAQELGLTFMDLDEEFERKFRITISSFFQKYNEVEFRLLERKILLETKKLDRFVISTGGGTPCFHENMTFIKENGISIYLKVSTPTLIHRLVNSRKPRPVLKSSTPEEMELQIGELLAKREPYYLQANYTVDEEHIDIALLRKILAIQPD